MDFTNLVDFQTLGTFMGSAGMTFLIVGVLKEYVQHYLKIPTFLFAVLVAAVLQVVAQIGNGADPANWTVYALALINAFPIAYAAGKMNDNALQPPSPQKPENPYDHD